MSLHIVRPITLVAWRTAAVALAAFGGGRPAYAQFPDVLSATECPGCAEFFEDMRFEGTWSSALTSPGDGAWSVEDFTCLVACTPQERATAADVRSLRFACDPHGFAAQVISPLPLQIERQAGRVVLRYEEFGAERTIWLDEHHYSHAGNLAPFGTSRARFEGRTLVVETHEIAAGRLHDWFGGRPHSDRLQAVERYTASDDGQWLNLSLELYDPATLPEPLVVTKRWRRVPGAKILSHGCDVMSGELTGVFAEYVDPRRLAALRRGH